MRWHKYQPELLCPDIPIVYYNAWLQSERSASFYFQDQDKYNCGSFSWSCCPTRQTQHTSPGKEQTENSSWWIQMRWLGGGEREKVNLTWTTTNYPEPYVTTTTRISWPKFTARDTHTSLTLLVWPRPCSLQQQTQQRTSTSRTSSCQGTTPTQNWTLWTWMPTLRCHRPRQGFSPPRPVTGPVQELTCTRTSPHTTWVTIPVTLRHT